LPLLLTATGLDTLTLETRLAPALEDGLLVAHQGHEREIRFRHDRVQQAMHERMDTADGDDTSLALARQLVRQPQTSALAAKLYLRVAASLHDQAECRVVRALFRDGAQASRVINYELSVRFLAAAIALSLRLQPEDGDGDVLMDLLIDQHAALYGLGRLDEADAGYAMLEAIEYDPYKLVDSAAVQMASLSVRSRHRDALDLGLDLLSRLGLQQPADIKAAIGMALFKMATWIAGNDKEADLTRPEVSDPAKTGAWLTMESHALWVEHGPCPALMATLCSTPMQLIAIAEDHEGANTLGRHLIRVGEARGYEPATSVARFLYAFCCSHWYRPLEDSLPLYRQAREGLFQGGDLQYAVFTYAAWLPLFDSAPEMSAGQEEVDGADAACQRTGDQNF